MFEKILFSTIFSKIKLDVLQCSPTFENIGDLSEFEQNKKFLETLMDFITREKRDLNLKVLKIFISSEILYKFLRRYVKVS